jgi:hypothetical protein
MARFGDDLKAGLPTRLQMWHLSGRPYKRIRSIGEKLVEAALVESDLPSTYV